MKHKLKTTLCSAIFSTLFLLNSCQVENEVINNGNDVKIEKFSFSNIKSLQKRGSTNSKIQQLAEAVNHAKIKLIKRNSQSRLIYDENLGIYFDDEAGIKISKEDYESYTFKIYRDNTNENSKLENLIFSENKNGGFDSYLVEYPYTEQEMLLNSGENLQNSNAEFTVLNKATEYICIGYVIYSGCSETHSNEVTCSGTEVSYDCYSSGGNGSSTGGSTGGTETGASTGGSSGVLTSPTSGSTGTTALANPCKKFKKQQEDYLNLKQDLINLEATKTQNHENGIFIGSNNPNVQNLPASTAQGAAVGVPNMLAPNKYKVIAHTHDASGPNGTGTYSIFSWGDLSLLADLIRTEQMDNDFFTLYLATADNTRYAITIDWSSAFSDFFDIRTNPNDPTQTNYFNSEKFKELSKIEKEYYKDEATVGSGKIGLATNPADDLKIFLKMIKELKLDVSLFEVDPTYSIFKKLTLSSNGTVVTGSPCN